MAWLQSSIYMIILLCFTDIFLQVQSKDEDSSGQADECFYKITCECQDSSEVKTCFDKLRPKVQEFVVDKVNKECDLGTEITDFSKLTTDVCSAPKSAAVSCLDIIKDELGKEANELISQKDYRSASSIGAFRGCLTPFFKKCSDGDVSCDGKE